MSMSTSYIENRSSTETKKQPPEKRSPSSTRSGENEGGDKRECLNSKVMRVTRTRIAHNTDTVVIGSCSNYTPVIAQAGIPSKRKEICRHRRNTFCRVSQDLSYLSPEISLNKHKTKRSLRSGSNINEPLLQRGEENYERLRKSRSETSQLKPNTGMNLSFLETSVEFPPKKKIRLKSPNVINSMINRSQDFVGNNLGDYLNSKGKYLRVSSRPAMEESSCTSPEKCVEPNSPLLSISTLYQGSRKSKCSRVVEAYDDLIFSGSKAEKNEDLLNKFPQLRPLPEVNRFHEFHNVSKASLSPISILPPRKRRKNTKLSKPASWANQNFYRFLFNFFKPRYGKEYRRKSEDFVIFLHPLVEAVVLLKEKDEYIPLLQKVKDKTKELGMCSSVRDWKALCDHLPFEFKAKSYYCGSSSFEPAFNHFAPF